LWLRLKGVRRAQLVLPVSLLALVACTVSLPSLPPAPSHPNGQALWHVVHDACVPDERSNGNPAPCVKVVLAHDEQHGFAILKDKTGVAQYLLMPTALITGIEDRRLLKIDATNYFALAWEHRSLVAERLGHVLPSDAVGVAVNSRYGRSQDLLHLHIDCLRQDVRATLAGRSPGLAPGWAPAPIMLLGHAYRISRVDGDTLGASPFRLLAHGLHVPPANMGAWTLVLTGISARDHPGFLLLAARADPARGQNGSGEELQDHNCSGV